MPSPAIIVNRVRKSFRRGEPVLKDISLRVEDAEMVALIGPSGSGKSTLIRLISGLESMDRADEASIRIFDSVTQSGAGITRASRDLRRDVGVIFQQFNLVPRLSLLGNVLAGRLGRVAPWRGLLGWFPRADRIKALQALERVGIVAMARQRASTLSGGQQQRGAIARALAQEARLILADEPIASLDPASAEQVMGILAGINRRDGVTVVVCLHQIQHALAHCTRIIALKDGEIVFDGPTGELGQAGLERLYGVVGEQHGAPATLESTASGPATGERGVAAARAAPSTVATPATIMQS